MNRYLLKVISLSLLIMLASTTGTASEANFSIDWYTIDGGGETATKGGDWALSGTIGQWDVSQTALQSGGSWELIGGFWGVSASETDELFKDSFED